MAINQSGSASDALQVLRQDLDPQNHISTDQFNKDISDIRSNPALLKSVIAASEQADTQKAGLPEVSIDDSGSIHIQANGSIGNVDFIQSSPDNSDRNNSLAAITRDSQNHIVSEQMLNGITNLPAEKFQYDGNGKLASFIDTDGETWTAQGNNKFVDEKQPSIGPVTASLDSATGTLTMEKGAKGDSDYESYVRQANGLTTEEIDKNGKSVVIKGRDEGSASGSDSSIYSQTFSDGTSRTFNYDSTGELSGIKDTNGTVWSTTEDTPWKSSNGQTFNGLIETDMDATSLVLYPDKKANGKSNGLEDFFSAPESTTIDLSSTASTPLAIAEAKVK